MGIAAAIAGVGAISSIAGGAIQAGAASSAAGAQEAAAKYAADLQQQRYEQTRTDLNPYNVAGQNANAEISAMPGFNFAPTQANLATTPGYQFALSQGLRGVQNSAAARGLGNSGAALRGAADYSTGLASNTYQQQFQNALTGYNTNLAKLQNQANLGENAGAQTGAIGAQLAGTAGQAIIGGANANAAGQIGVANALSGGISGVGNAYLTSQLFGANGMYGAGSYGNGGSIDWNNPVNTAAGGGQYYGSENG